MPSALVVGGTGFLGRHTVENLVEHDLEPADFILYHHPATGYPHVHETCKIGRLGWDSTSAEEAMRRTVEERIEYLRDRPDPPPNRAAEERLLAELAH